MRRTLVCDTASRQLQPQWSDDARARRCGRLRVVGVRKKLEMLGSIVSRLAHYDTCVNLSTLCNRGIFWQGAY